MKRPPIPADYREQLVTAGIIQPAPDLATPDRRPRCDEHTRRHRATDHRLLHAQHTVGHVFLLDDTMPDWDRSPADFTAVELVRLDPAANARRYYHIAWEPTLLDDHAVIRGCGRKGAW